MNRTKIEWTDRTLNPIVGCPHGCPFCYAPRQAKRQKHRCQLCYDFTPHPHLERLTQLTPRQKPMKIFLDSMWDWNSDGIKQEWLIKILHKIKECPQHTFQILSKRPERYDRFVYPNNVWLGTSISEHDEYWRIYQLLDGLNFNLKFVSVEPLHGLIDLDFRGFGWIIVGAETGRRKDKITPKKEWIDELVKGANWRHIPIFLKNNLGLSDPIQEFPGVS